MPREDREPDELFEIRTNFYTGNYQQVINEATKLKVSRVPSRSSEHSAELAGACRAANGERSVHVPIVHRAEEVRCCARRNSAELVARRARGRAIARGLSGERFQTVNSAEYAGWKSMV